MGMNRMRRGRWIRSIGLVSVPVSEGRMRGTGTEDGADERDERDQGW